MKSWVVVAIGGAALLGCSSADPRTFEVDGDAGADVAPSPFEDSGPSPVPTGPTFGVTCNGMATTVSGTVHAPNGTDPLPNIYVYAARTVHPFPTGNYCNQCNMPLDDWYTHVQTAPDGTFSLDLSTVPAGPDIQFVINVGRFRKVTKLPVKCGPNTATAPATNLPGKAADGDIPKIAVTTGNVDHLDQILNALGITDYDCFEGRATTTSSSTCMPKDTVANLLTNTGSKIDDYHLLFMGCAPGAYKKFGTPAMAANANAFVTAGGRMFVTDNSYDYVAQAFPSAITWMGPAGTPQPVDGANVGNAGTYTGTIDDPNLAAWLKVVGAVTGNTVPLQGFLKPWSVQASLPKSSTLIVDGAVSTTTGTTTASSDVPLTTQFDVSACGRVVYSSYHTAGGTSTMLLPQERILEYLVFQVGTCVGPIPN